MTNYDTQSGLNNRYVSSPSSGVKDQGVDRAGSHCRLRGSRLRAASGFWRCQPSLSFRRCLLSLSSLACGWRVTPVPARLHVAFFPVHLSLCLFSSSFENTSPHKDWIKGPPYSNTPMWLDLNYLHWQWPYFQVRPHPKVLEKTGIWGRHSSIQSRWSTSFQQLVERKISSLIKVEVSCSFHSLTLP